MVAGRPRADNVAVKFSCPHCENSVHFAADKLGESVTCQNCGEPFELPSAFRLASLVEYPARMTETPPSDTAETTSNGKPTKRPCVRIVQISARRYIVVDDGKSGRVNLDLGWCTAVVPVSKVSKPATSWEEAKGIAEAIIKKRFPEPKGRR